MERDFNGFTLLEMVVAVAILGISIAVVMETFSLGSRSILLTEDYSTACLLAESKMADLKMQAGLEEGTSKGDFGGEYDRFGWEATVSPTEIERIKELRVKVSWPGRREEKKVELVTLRTELEGSGGIETLLRTIISSGSSGKFPMGQ